ncbi:hypothetical protein A2526_02075 [candidate division WOR-1 bacterium RIFOXYD2_FULL_36_8]|uniref:ATP synthase archaeal subunit H n=1 Tax=candidate division WOR-1 bacterium RIFOXYB2_FULL_36_35 TaxID=1802578 RepID=A0A1F4RZY5_UNCSA|nr:MAG: hypothetical protein A2230_00195 [candidate division WOR-1 bacterium RIFOXYA2_FULL_36_21]OGC13748.1 MAG: hypothetical protein A2290_07735 [candidate division WOR-1 bacterium RIFOXYB2_FULL_36_35]OGC14471.1 MAG: hypothetical protein A2282_08735 [candidate division WOR-1 bacterium RIFOXYA12_FULL_36_13]OGC41326.1 MAG: hypothetical protein A2526_02075 [candidate division WOR-1 bacterium RIFOXYD2_FULL_36_8]
MATETLQKIVLIEQEADKIIENAQKEAKIIVVNAKKEGENLLIQSKKNACDKVNILLEKAKTDAKNEGAEILKRAENEIEDIKKKAAFKLNEAKKLIN